MRGRKVSYLISAAVLAAVSPVSRATDIFGVQVAALDQPRINAIVRLDAAADPLFADIFGSRAFNISAFFDTGASGVLISPNTASSLGDLYNPGLPLAFHNGTQVKFYDVGVAGEDVFNVSVPVHISLAPTSTYATEAIGMAEEDFNNEPSPTFQNIDLSVYNQSFGNIRAQVGQLVDEDPNDPNQNPFLNDLDVFGMPTMKGKVIVMNPKPVDNAVAFLAGTPTTSDDLLMETHVYDRDTPATGNDDDPGIPKTTRTVKLSYGNFGRFTRVTPTGAQGATLEHNPFIGPSPTDPADNAAPAIKFSYNNKTTTGSFLLDTGAAASMISSAKALALGITLDKSDPDHPVLIGVPTDEQFTLTIGGVGGNVKVAGFYLSDLLVRTKEGNVNNDLDPKHIHFYDTPVLVADITLKDPVTQETKTLDGIFGMNLLSATAFVSEDGGAFPGFPLIDLLTPGAFDVVVFDEFAGELKLRPRLPGDANRDGKVDFSDLVKVAAEFGGEAPPYWEGGDFDGDGQVSFSDLLAAASHFGVEDLFNSDYILLPNYPFTFGEAGAAVPEPGIALLALGAMASLTRRSRRGG
jgi:hypothetical protein